MSELKYLDLTGLTQFWGKAKEYIDNKDKETSENIVYSNSTEMLIDVGGIKKGTSFENQTVQQMFDALLYPYVAPSVSVRGNVNGGTFEYGNTQTISSATVSITKGSRDITSVKLANGFTDIETKTGEEVKNGGSISFTFSGIQVAGGQNTRLTATVIDSDSKQYTAQTGSFTWIYPFFHGVTSKNAADITQEDILAATKDLSSKGTKSYSYTTNDNKAMIAYPKSYGTLTKITDSSGVTDYTAVWGSPTTVSVTSTNPAWGPVEYYVYTSGASTASNFGYKFTF